MVLKKTIWDHKSVKGIDEHLLLKQDVLGQRPEAEGDSVLRKVVVGQVLENRVHELVLLVCTCMASGSR